MSWQDKALAAFWADAFANDTLDSHRRIEAAIIAAAASLLPRKENQVTEQLSEHGTAPPLSPAAQAVVATFGTYPVRAEYVNGDLIHALAAALRVAADHCTHDKLTLYCIADELDGHSA